MNTFILKLLLTILRCDLIDFYLNLIRNSSKNNLDVTLNIIKEFVIKGKSLKYLTYAVVNYPSFPYNLKRLVEETKNIVTMKLYDDLVLKASDIDGLS